MSSLRLIGDIGGTNARFAVAQDGAVEHLRILHTGEYPTLAQAAREFLAALPPALRPSQAALAMAGPVVGGRARLTNQRWAFSIDEAKRELGFSELLVVNDFAATAMAIPYLSAADLMTIGNGVAVPGGPVGLVGPGTGLGMGCLIRADASWMQLPSEGGHATMPAATDEESRVLAVLRARSDHVSAERVLSGSGLVNLYAALCELAGVPARALEPAEITAAALAGADACCGRALDLFCAMLGTIAGNLALTFCATGGVYVAGGIVPRFKEWLAASEFRDRFEAKGRLGDYVRAIPTWLILHPWPALLGLANLDAFRQPRG